MRRLGAIAFLIIVLSAMIQYITQKKMVEAPVLSEEAESLKSSQVPTKKDLFSAKNAIGSIKNYQVSRNSQSGAAQYPSSSGPSHAIGGPIDKQPSTGEISKRTLLPALNGSELKISGKDMLAKAQNGETFSIEVHKGVWVEIEPSHTREDNGFTTVVGRTLDKKRGEVFLTTDGEDLVVGLIQRPPMTFQFVGSGRKTVYVVTVDKSKTPKNYEPQAAINSKIGGHAETSAGFGGSPTSDFTETQGVLEPPVQTQSASSRQLRVYFYFSGQFLAAHANDLANVRASIANQVAITNTILSNSGVNLNFVVSGTGGMSNITDTQRGEGEVLGLLDRIMKDKNRGAYDTLLDSSKTDLIHVMRAHADFDYCGYAYIGDQFWHEGHRNQPDFFAANVGISAHACAYKYTLSHELGHNIGLDHDTENASELSKAYFNRGFRNDAAHFRTLMAYNNEVCGVDVLVDPLDPTKGYRSTCQVIPYLSTPNRFAGGGPIGSNSLNNGKKADDIAKVIFQIPRVVGDGESFFNQAASGPKKITLKKGQSLLRRVSPTYQTSYTLPSSYASLYHNNILIEKVKQRRGSSPYSGYNRRFYFGSQPDLPAKTGETVEVRVGNRLGFRSAKYIAEVHTPLVVSALTPKSRVVKPSTPVELKVEIKGHPRATCNWTGDGASGSGTSYRFTPTWVEEYSRLSISYTCRRNSAYGSNEQVAAHFQITVIRPPKITSQPQSQNIGGTGELSLSVSATGADLIYSWYKNDQKIEGQRRATLNLSGGNLVGSYRVKVTNQTGSVMSQVALVSSSQAPQIQILAQPGAKVNEGSDLRISAQVSSSPGAQLEWTHKGRVVGRGNSLLLSNISRSQSGPYTLKATNSQGFSQKTIMIEVHFPPKITLQPIARLEVNKSESIVLSLEVEAEPAPKYQWYFINEQGVESRVGATSRVLRIPNSEWHHGGSYYCQVSNSLGSISSNRSRVTIAPLRRQVNLGEIWTESPIRLPAGIKIETPIVLDRSGGFEEALQ